MRDSVVVVAVLGALIVVFEVARRIPVAFDGVGVGLTAGCAAAAVIAALFTSKRDGRRVRPWAYCVAVAALACCGLAIRQAFAHDVHAAVSSAVTAAGLATTVTGLCCRRIGRPSALVWKETIRSRKTVA